MEFQKDISAFGSEELMLILELAPRDRLDGIANKLRAEIPELARKLTSKTNTLNLIDAYLVSAPNPTPQCPPLEIASEVVVTEILGGAVNEVGEESGKSSPTTNQGDLEAGDEKTEKITRPRKERGTIAQRNLFIHQLTEDRDDWLHRTEYEKAFVESGLVSEDDNVKEVVRSFLRQAKNDPLIDVTVYRLAGSNKVVTALMYGLPQFIMPENRATYELKLKNKVRELGFFMTEEEGTKFKASRGTQYELSTH